MRERAAEVAIAQIGDAYIGGADGPHAFDCSGLTQYAWRKAGVELTHYSGAQWKETRRISIAKAEPGDLAFYFENGAHHVAMYVGNGMVVGAVDYGIGVKKTPLVGTPWTDLHFSGMGRVILRCTARLGAAPSLGTAHPRQPLLRLGEVRIGHAGSQEWFAAVVPRVRPEETHLTADPMQTHQRLAHPRV
jgi:hypothetical protein